MLGCIHKASLARHCVLSVNENEAFCIARTVYKEELRLEAILERLVQDGYADEVVIHTRYKALAFDGIDYAEEMTDYVDKPLFSTGAGDNFNGGYCGALLKKQPSQSVCKRPTMHPIISLQPDTKREQKILIE